MRALELDYMARPAWASWPGLSILAFSLVVAAGAFTFYFIYSDESNALQARWSQLDRSDKRVTGLALSEAAIQEMQSEVKRANEVTAQLDLPWSQLFQAVEASSQDTVALLGIQPDAQKRMVSIAAEGKDMQSAVEYVKRLEQQTILSAIHIVNHQLQDQDPEKPMRFSIQATWREQLPAK